MNETRDVLSMLDFVKVFINKNNLRDYRVANVKLITIIIIKCISINDRSLLSLII